MKISALVLVLSSLLIGVVVTVDRNKFRTCSQSGFCNRARNVSPGNSPYSLDLSTLKVSPTLIEAVILNRDNDVRFRLEIFALKDNTFRLKIREAFPLIPRFEVPEVLVGGDHPEQVPLEVSEKDPQRGFVVRSKDNRVVISADPFRADFYSGDVLVLSANARGLMKFEHTRRKKPAEAVEDHVVPTEEPPAEQDELDDQILEEQKLEMEEKMAKHVDNDGHMAWEESFGGNTDSKPNGPQAVAMDFTFMNTEHVYGIPEHADRFSLQDTSSGDPYRLYNLDVFEYEMWNPMALYAAVPFMIGHNEARTTGLFWLNAAETWIDVKKSGTGVLGSISNLVSSAQPQVETHWMSESGIIDVFVLLGPTPKDVSKQYAALTGTTPLPPAFSLAYHQCRWNYNDQEDVNNVESKFDEHDIPMDVMWLDIEHTDGKKYFTWDARKFPDSIGMINNLTAHGRKLVTIVDPHIKKESNYWVYDELRDLGLFVKNKEGNDYEGWCWPGASYYPDFLNPEARDYFAKQYALDKYIGTTLDTYTWNDMNEPSVFNGPEITMPKDIIHMGNFEHRDLHNIYGHLYIMSTHKGHLLRSDNKLRPFILSRSGFAGSQRYAALWTGDNTAEWSHLEASVPMCLSMSVAGITHCGADIGGFFGNPDGEMFVRWYQAAAFQPFFRSHAHIDTKRREPWLYSSSELKLIRDAIRIRYSYLPYWYTLFYEGEITGIPPMRPLWYEFPKDKASFGIDSEHLVGDALLVRPVSAPDLKTIDVYFPSESIWYNIFTYEVTKESKGGTVSVPLTYSNIPVYQRGGTIIPKKERLRRSSKLMHHDPYTLVVAVDEDGTARGTLYIDDGESFGYRNGEYIYINFDFRDGKLSGHSVTNPGYKTYSWLERVVILGYESGPPSKIILKSPIDGECDLDYKFDPDKKVLIVRKPGVNMGEDWDMFFS